MRTGGRSTGVSSSARSSGRHGGRHTPQPSADIADRLRKLRDDGTLESFTEKGAGCHVWVIANNAIALVGSEMVQR